MTPLRRIRPRHKLRMMHEHWPSRFTHILSGNAPTMVILSPFDVIFEREISSDASHRTLFQKDDSGDWEGRIRATSSRAVCSAVRVRAC